MAREQGNIAVNPNVVVGKSRQTTPPPNQIDSSPQPIPTSNLRNVPPPIRAVLTRIAVNEQVAPDAIAGAFLSIVELSPPTRDVVFGSLMTAVMTRGPVADEIAAVLRSALALDTRGPIDVISFGDRPVLMLAGSGKKGVRTLNVSTPAALVAASAGARVIKVGSTATSSALGSRDLVSALGLREHRNAADVRAELARSGFAFVAVEPEIPLLDTLYGGRFHAPNPFSFGLAPLASPIRGDIAVFGLSHPRVDVAAHVLNRLGIHSVDVLSTRLPGGHYVDEICSTGELRQCRARDGEIGPVIVEPADHLVPDIFGGELPPASGASEAIQRTRELLAGGGLESHRALVALNAGHLLALSGIAPSIRKGAGIAEEVLRHGVQLARFTATADAAKTADLS